MSTVVTIKVVLLGNSGVGKSSIGLRFAQDRFLEEQEPTLGAAYLSKTLTHDGKRIKINIWDTAGQERYRAMARMYYQDAQAAILVYDICSRESFTELKNWYRELRDNGPAQIGTFQLAIVVAGNKSDLEDREAVSHSEAQKWAASIGAEFLRTSTRTNHNIEALFRAVLVQKGAEPNHGGEKLTIQRPAPHTGCPC